MALDPITAGIELVGNIVGSVNDRVKQDREIKAAAAENTTRLLRDKETNNSAWEMAVLAGKDLWLQRACFAIFIFPFFWAIFDPKGVADYFTTVMAAMPEWYVQIVIGMVGSIWGISALKNTVPALVAQIVKAARR